MPNVWRGGPETPAPAVSPLRYLLGALRPRAPHHAGKQTAGGDSVPGLRTADPRMDQGVLRQLLPASASDERGALAALRRVWSVHALGARAVRGLLSVLAPA